MPNTLHTHVLTQCRHWKAFSDTVGCWLLTWVFRMDRLMWLKVCPCTLAHNEREREREREKERESVWEQHIEHPSTNVLVLWVRHDSKLFMTKQIQSLNKCIEAFTWQNKWMSPLKWRQRIMLFHYKLYFSLHLFIINPSTLFILLPFPFFRRFLIITVLFNLIIYTHTTWPPLSRHYM